MASAVDRLTDALAYAAFGIPVFPLNGKIPFKDTRGFYDATTDSAAIRQWWALYPDANIGAPTGFFTDAITGERNAIPFDVLDVDAKNGTRGPESLAALVARHGDLPRTPRLTTGTGGTHYYFWSTGTLRDSVGQLGAGLDIRGTGGYVVLPPSRHPDTGMPYRWHAGCALDELTLAVLPDWIPAILQQSGNRLHFDEESGPIPAGERNRTLFRIGCKYRRGGMAQGEIEAALDAINQTRCQPEPLTDDEITKIAASCAKYEPGRAGPAITVNGGTMSGLPTDHTEPGPVEATPAFRLSDLGNAERLVHRYRDTMRYCPQLGDWLMYQETRDPNGDVRSGYWRRDDEQHVLRLAQHTIRAIYTEADATDDLEARQRLAKHAIKSEQSPRLEAMVRQAQVMEDIIISADTLDQDAWLLNVANGTIDLHTGELRRPRKADYITRMIPIAYEPDAPRATWTHFLAQVFFRPGGDGSTTTELMTYAKRLFGYAITGDPRERVLPILWGSGRNGKTTLLEAIHATLGEGYASAIDPPLLYAKRDDSRNQQQIAQLRGKRFAIAVEGAENQKLDSALVKRLTGEDTITGRFLYKNEFKFTPTHVIALGTNHRPRITDTTKSIWDRLRLLPFSTRFFLPDEPEYSYCAEWQRADVLLKSKLKHERAGILAWLVEGARDYAECGLVAPELVRKSTNEYKASEDSIGRFVSERCLTLPDVSVLFKELYAAYLEWHGETLDGEPMNENTFGRRLTEKDFPTGTTGWGSNKQRIRLGLRLNPEEARDPNGTDSDEEPIRTHFPESPPMESTKEKFSGEPSQSVPSPNQFRADPGDQEPPSLWDDDDHEPSGTHSEQERIGTYFPDTSPMERDREKSSGEAFQCVPPQNAFHPESDDQEPPGLWPADEADAMHTDPDRFTR